jgi:hypothetical protein
MLAMLDEDDKKRFWPRSFSLEPLERDPVTVINEPPLPDNVSVMVPKPRSLRAVIAQSLKDTEALIGRLELGVRVADSGRGLIRELYVQARKQREVLSNWNEWWGAASAPPIICTRTLRWA